MLVKDMQKLAGTLNFLCRAIFAGHAFIRRFHNSMMVKDGLILKQHHHIRVNGEIKADCQMWIDFLDNYSQRITLCWLFIDLKKFESSETLFFYTDSSANKRLGFGGVFGYRWLFERWEPGYIAANKPSIEYLELAALCIVVITWGQYLTNTRIVIFCNNQAVVHMVNNSTSRCPNCMILLRMLVKDGLIHNRRIFVKYVTSKDNYLSDCLSRMKIQQFKTAAPWMRNELDKPTPLLWPLSKLWNRFH